MYASGKNFGVAAPRGFAKTTIGSVELLYRIVNQQGHFALVVSDTYSQARDIVDNVKAELTDNALLRWVYGDMSSEYHWTSGAFTTANQYRVIARGSNMKVRGLKYKQWRPDFALVDDLENDELVASEERRQKLFNWYKKALMPAMARKNSQIAVIGTILHDDSLLNNIVKGQLGFKGWLRRLWAAIETKEDGSEQSIWPEMFSLEDLRRMRDDPDYDRYLGPLVFAQEMMNEAIDDQSRIFKREWIYGTTEKPYPYSLSEAVARFEAIKRLEGVSVEDWTGLWLTNTFSKILMAVDPAISEKTTADCFAIFVLGVAKMDGHLYMLDVVNERIGDIDRQVQLIIETAKQWRPEEVKVEAVAYQAGLANAVLKQSAAQNVYIPVMQVRPDKDKFRRATIHSANFAGGLVHLRTDHPLFEALVKQLLDFPLGKHDDMLDAYMHAAEDITQRRQTRVWAEKPDGF